MTNIRKSDIRSYSTETLKATLAEYEAKKVLSVGQNEEIRYMRQLLRGERL